MTPEDIRVRNRLANLRGQMTREIRALKMRADRLLAEGKREGAYSIGTRQQGVIDARLMVDRMIARLEGKR